MLHDDINLVWNMYAKEQKEVSLDSLREEIAKSWERSRDNLIDIYRQEVVDISNEELQQRKSKADVFIQAALPYLHKLYKIVQKGQTVITITDRDAVVLEVISSDKMRTISNYPYAGSIHREDVIGTNSIGTSIYTDKAIQIRGAEHWLFSNHKWVCSSAPIHVNNQIVGCLTLFCLLLTGDYHEHTLGLIVTTANAIEREIMLNKALYKKQIIVQQQKAVLEVIDSGIIVIDRYGVITQTNQQAFTIFNVSGAWEGRNIDELIRSSIDFRKLMIHGRMLKDQDVSIKIGKRYQHISFSTFKINLDSIGIGMIIRVRASTSIREMVNKVTGAHAYYTFEDIIGESEAMYQPMKIARLAGKNTINVLISGETGTGKELVAQAIHNASDRTNKPFIAINCGALSRELIQSELFGYEEGSFTGAKKDGNPGKFELADGGTLFLDEIGELPLEAQVNLLRVLQTGEVLRIGAKYPNSIDVRIISATNKDLYESVQELTFRNDLYYRLNVLSIKLPPLRDRTGDIKLLSNYLLQKILHQFGVYKIVISEEVYDVFQHYSWPGNIRELENVLQRAVVICKKRTITLKDLSISIKQQSALLQYSKQMKPKEQMNKTSIENLECKQLIKALIETSGNLRKTSQLLGVSRGTVYNMINRYHLDINYYR